MMEIYYNLALDDIVPNAFIELKKVDNSVTSIPLKIIENYGEAVKNKIISNGGHARLCLNRNCTAYFLRCYDKYFYITQIENDSYVVLNDDISVEELIVSFRKFIEIDVLLAFMDKEVVDKSLIKPTSENKQFTKIRKYS